MDRRPGTAELHELERLFPGYRVYCPLCQSEAMEAHMERNTRWYAVVCIPCDLKAAAQEAS